MVFGEVFFNEEIKLVFFKILKANGMWDEIYICLILIWGKKIILGMDFCFNQFGLILIIVLEWKLFVYLLEIMLVIFLVCCNFLMFFDFKIYYNNFINNILAKIEVNYVGVDVGLMFDKDGFVLEVNGVNVFCICKGVVYIFYVDSCLLGIICQYVINLCWE